MLKYFQKKSSRNGFTLIEMLVVLFVISLLSVMILADYQGNKKNYALLQANQKLISDLRKVQNMAINGTEIIGYCSVTSVCYGYGIYLDSGSSYILFADKNDNKVYDAGVGEGFETVNFPSPIIIQSTNPSPVSVFFLAPDPITYINGSNVSGILAEIILQVSGSALTKAININTAGLIE